MTHRLRRFTLSDKLTDKERDQILNEWSRDVEEAVTNLPEGHASSGGIFVTGGSTAYIPGTSYVTMEAFAQATGNPEVVLEQPPKNRLVLGSTGLWLATLSVSFSGTANATFDFALALDNNRIPGGVLRRKLGGSGDVGCAATAIVFRAGAGQSLSVHVKSGAGAQQYTLVEGSLNAARQA